MVNNTNLPGLKLARLSAGLEQKDLARLLGVNPVSVSRWETGARTPAVPQINAIAKALKCSVAQLVTSPEEAPADA